MRPRLVKCDMKNATITAIAIVAAAAIAAASSLATTHLNDQAMQKTGATSADPQGVGSSNSGSTALQAGTAQCPTVSSVGSTLSLSISVGDASGQLQCFQANESFGRLSAQVWRTIVVNNTGNTVPSAVLRWNVPSALEIVPGSVEFYNESYRHGYVLSDLTPIAGLETGTFSPNGAWMEVEFTTRVIAKNLAPCAERTEDVWATLTGAITSPWTSSSVHLADPNPAC